jgi:hypothetical protein
MSRKKNKTIGVCRLCCEPKELIVQSHVISGFLLRQILNKENKGFSTLKIQDKKSRPVQDAAHEPDLLCENCDQVILGSYENYAKRLFFGELKKKDELIEHVHDEYMEFQNIDYQKLKLFLLSLVWRASISKKNSTFQLSNEMEDLLRTRLFSNSNVRDDEFPVFISSYLHSGVPKELILSPYIVEKNDGQYFIFLAGGMHFIICLKDHKLCKSFPDFILKQNGSVKVRELNPNSIKRTINHYLGINYFVVDQ